MSIDGEELLEEIDGFRRRVAEMLPQLKGEGVGKSVSAFRQTCRQSIRKPKLDIGGRVLWEAARAEMAEIELREKYLPAELCMGASWHILLFLITSQIEKRSVAITDACYASRVPATTALRQIELLVERDFCTREVDPSDKRRSWLKLSHRGYLQMGLYFSDKQRIGGRYLRFPTD